MTNYEKLLNVIKETFPEIDCPKDLLQAIPHCDCYGMTCPDYEGCNSCPYKNFWNKEYGQNKTKPLFHVGDVLMSKYDSSDKAVITRLYGSDKCYLLWHDGETGIRSFDDLREKFYKLPDRQICVSAFLDKIKEDK